VKAYLSNLPWFGIIVTLVIVVGLGGASWLIYAMIDDYRRQCHNVGGHIIDVKGNEICVDHDNRIIFV
jgi:hypothetical protein